MNLIPELIGLHADATKHCFLSVGSSGFSEDLCWNVTLRFTEYAQSCTRITVFRNINQSFQIHKIKSEIRRMISVFLYLESGLAQWQDYKLEDK